MDERGPSGNRASLLQNLSDATCQHTITTGLDDNNLPIDRARTLLPQGKVYLYSTWSQLPDRQVPATISLQDPDGTIVHTADSTFLPVNGAWISFAWYTFKPTDSPGVWRFEVALDGQDISSCEFVVHRGHGVVTPPPSDE